MAAVEKRVSPKTGKTTWRVRYRDPAGRECSKSFTKASLAKDHALAVEADKQRGSYIDVARGRITFRQFAEVWLEGQRESFAVSTRATKSHHLKKHILPTFGSLSLSAITSSTVQAWIKTKSETLAPRTVGQVHQTLSQILAAAVDDDRLVKNVARAASVRLPRIEPGDLVVWTEEQVKGLRDALPEQWKILLLLGIGLGLRQGEVLALSPSDVNWMRGEVRIQRQIVVDAGKLLFSLPKYNKPRTVPLSDSLRDELAAYLMSYPARDVTLPWASSNKPTTVSLFLTTRQKTALDRNYVNRYIWRPARVQAGLDDVRENGMHGSRHFYASAQLEAGCSIRALADWLGHTDPAFTLRVYTKIMPASVERGRTAIDDLFGRLDAHPTALSDAQVTA